MLKRMLALALLILIAGCATVDSGRGDHKHSGKKKVYGGEHDHRH